MRWMVLLFLVAGCGRQVQREAPAAAAQAVPLAAAPEEHKVETFRVTVRPKADANQYEAELQWEVAPRSAPLSVLRKSRTGTAVLEVPPEASSITDEIGGGQEIEYLLTTLAPVEPPLILHARVVAPLDRVIEGPEEIDEIANVHRLFLRKGADVVAKGRRLKIVVDTLVADEGASLRALRPGSKASRVFGVSRAPDILVRARKAVGDLKIFTDGEAGLEGLPGAEGTRGASGQRGLDAVVHLHPGRDAAHEWCERQATNGTSGGRGGQGGRGSRGGDGGDSAYVFVRVDEPSSFIARVSGEPGRGGKGGPGGPGGPGGAGGGAGAHRPPCHQIAFGGNSGPNGLPGPEGEPGQDGKAAPWCLRLGGATFGTCTPATPEPQW